MRNSKCLRVLTVIPPRINSCSHPADLLIQAPFDSIIGDRGKREHTEQFGRRSFILQLSCRWRKIRDDPARRSRKRRQPVSADSKEDSAPGSGTEMRATGRNGDGRQGDKFCAPSIPRNSWPLKLVFRTWIQISRPATLSPSRPVVPTYRQPMQLAPQPIAQPAPGKDCNLHSSSRSYGRT
jgi:hypothetical protein